MQPDIGFVGAGKVGNVLARLWNQAGFKISAVTSRTEAHAQALAHFVNAARVNSAAEVVQRSDLTMLTVNDDAIAAVAALIARSNLDLSGKAIVHTSGAKSLDALSDLKARGANVGSLHPAFPFAAIDTALEKLPGATFAVEVEDEGLWRWLVALVSALHGEVITIPSGDKALYHAALVIASNYAVVLFYVAEQLLEELGASPQAAHKALTALLGGTAVNLKQTSTASALTGPLVRGDLGTVTAHLQALSPYPQVRTLYKQLTEAALPILKQRGIESETLTTIEGWLANTDRSKPKDEVCD